VTAVSLLLASCTPALPTVTPEADLPAAVASASAESETAPQPTPIATRETFSPGQLVDYKVQTGDNLPALAARFNTSVAEIRAANLIIPDSATTLPAGMPMEIPIYYRSFWGNPFQILPDTLFINGPRSVSFDTARFVESQPGWLKDYVEYASGQNRSGAEIVDFVATNYSISPQVLLALIEYQAGGLSNPDISQVDRKFVLGYKNEFRTGLYLQLNWAANILNNGYYGWRTGELIELELKNGRTERPDPWQNAGTVAFQYLFNQLSADTGQFNFAIGPQGIARVFTSLYGDIWVDSGAHIPPSLEQPPLTLPFEPYVRWAYTGGPHTGWGSGAPFAALDFGPPSIISGCFYTDLFATAVADGLVTRVEESQVVLDLDMDGDERTGWVIIYLHLASRNLVTVGTTLKRGEPVGHPSCEGGNTTGTHVHISRKYNGEWMSAEGVVPFNMEGWIPVAGAEAYLGQLIRFERSLDACTCSDSGSWIESTGYPDGVRREGTAP
jgi:murein DD-endopeptidase MepM/ murein hydrolase activator NlpD